MKKIITSKVLFQIFPSLLSSKLLCPFLAQLVVVSEALPVPGGAESLLPQQPGCWPGGFVIPWLGLTWNLFPSLKTSRVSKIHLKKTSCMVYSSGPSSRVRFDDTSFPACGLRRRESQGAWYSGNGGVFELLPPAKELCKSIPPPSLPEGLSGHSHAIVEYPYLCTKKMKGLGVSDWWDG